MRAHFHNSTNESSHRGQGMYASSELANSPWSVCRKASRQNGSIRNIDVRATPSPNRGDITAFTAAKATFPSDEDNGQ
jgi:hypothetical protein